jgi:hypothetical protein
VASKITHDNVSSLGADLIVLGDELFHSLRPNLFFFSLFSFPLVPAQFPHLSTTRHASSQYFCGHLGRNVDNAWVCGLHLPTSPVSLFAEQNAD